MALCTAEFHCTLVVMFTREDQYKQRLFYNQVWQPLTIINNCKLRNMFVNLHSSIF